MVPAADAASASVRKGIRAARRLRTSNKALDAGGVMVGDEVAISIDVEAIKKQ
jgi:hypothetical protein